MLRTVPTFLWLFRPKLFQHIQYALVSDSLHSPIRKSHIIKGPSHQAIIMVIKSDSVLRVCNNSAAQVYKQRGVIEITEHCKSVKQLGCQTLATLYEAASLALSMPLIRRVTLHMAPALEPPAACMPAPPLEYTLHPHARLSSLLHATFQYHGP